MEPLIPDSELPVGLESLQGALEVFSEYDVARLLAYWERGDPDRIAIETFGRSLALRFDEVGYFNRVYHVDDVTIARLADLLPFYDGVDQPVHLVGAAGFDSSRHLDTLRAFGFQPGVSYARLLADTSSLPSEPVPAGIEILSRDELDPETFFEVYLRGFGVEEMRLASAKANMLRLFDVPNLHFFLGRVDGSPAGIGMLYMAGEYGFLCAGTTLPGFEKRGCHTAVIRHRLAMARELGASIAISWAAAGGASHKNLGAQGLTTVSIDRSWTRPAPLAR